ncbi:protein phosphatase [Bifidobacterium pseudolongum subsp. globosum]|uniref:Protein phosphatase n=1 Tax=Bifidobacterium pseudolongum subsp. globosum TaxID=1690 RepID=A0A4Q4ZYY1_9BIFI|nr:protein phosphatase 2C domain-containing protein [Bifidobacterium pseudolongum]RYQ08881.1 protein phosphatase [Bifidobacterium pseudolongum subsp. globosum]
MNEAIAVGALTDVGMRRATNQDAFLAERGVYVVCDGMGGESGGERASAIAVEEFARLAAGGERTRVAIDAAVQRAQRRARALGVRLGGIAGTTISGIVLPQWGTGAAPHGAHAAAHMPGVDAEPVIDDWDATQPGATLDDSTITGEWQTARGGCADPCYVVNIGDSRTYHMERADSAVMTWDARTFTQLTHDHSSRQEAIDAGMDEAEAGRRIARNVITRCIGAPHGTRADVFMAPARGRFIICSDGCHGELEDATIASIAAAHDDAAGAARALVQASLDAGGSDNVTVVVVDMPAGRAALGARLEDDEDLGDVHGLDDATVQTRTGAQQLDLNAWRRTPPRDGGRACADARLSREHREEQQAW